MSDRPHEDTTVANDAVPDASGTPWVTRSQERITVKVQRLPTEVIRFRKVVVTEEVTQTFLLRHEELVIEREPAPPIDDVPAPADIQDLPAPCEAEWLAQDLEIVLHAEEMVTTVRAVPVERITVTTEAITRDVHISDLVHTEHVDAVGPQAADTDAGTRPFRR